MQGVIFRIYRQTSKDLEGENKKRLTFEEDYEEVDFDFLCLFFSLFLLSFFILFFRVSIVLIMKEKGSYPPQDVKHLMLLMNMLIAGSFHQIICNKIPKNHKT